MEERNVDERVCLVHQGGKHCWHEYGLKGYRGKYEVSSPVECCHCKTVAVQRTHAAEWLEFGTSATSSQEKP